MELEHLTTVGIEDDRKLSPQEEEDATRLLDHLHWGEENGKGVAQLAGDADLSQRKVKALVAHLRGIGFPICGTTKTGYFMPNSREEAMSTMNFFSAKYASTRSCLEGISRGLDTCFPRNALEQTEAVA
jgi:hypothetical protein